MEVGSGFHSLLQNLKMEGPWIPAKTWESIPSESGAARSIDPAQGPQDSIYDITTVSETILVRVVINALQGVKSAIIEIEKLSQSFCSVPADRTIHRVPSVWCRLSSTHALGRMLKSLCHAGLKFFFLCEFVSYYLCTDHNDNLVTRNMSVLIPTNVGQDKHEMKSCPPFSLVNQAFAVAIKKLLEGYICALSTLSASIKLRRSAQCKSEAVPINDVGGTLTSVVHSEITVLEVYLHTNELRKHIEALGSICFSQLSYQCSLSDDLTSSSIVDFHNFPRGADLLTYLYVQLRDADQVHHALLKYLFVHSYEPYCGFIKLWMYRATIDDPYGEFFIASSDTTLTSNGGSFFLDNFSLASIKEHSGVSIPSFLEDASHLLLRAGQQLQVLLKLLDLCNLSFSGEYVPCDLSNLRDILPFLVDSSGKLDILSLPPLIFGRLGMEALIQKRELMYRNMLENLQNYFKKLNTNYCCASRNVAFGSMPVLRGRSGLNVAFPSVFCGESNFSQGDINVASGCIDSDASSSFDESSFKLEPSQSSKCSSYDSSEETEPRSYSDLHDTVFEPSKSMFSTLPAFCAKKNILQSYSKTDWLCSHPHPPTQGHCEFPATSPSLLCQNRQMDQISAPIMSYAIKNLRISENLNEGYQSGVCWPLGGLQKNPFCAYMKCRGGKQLQFTEYGFGNDDGASHKFRCEEAFFAEASGPVRPEFHVFNGVQTSNGAFELESCQLSSSSRPYTFSMNPMLTNTSWLSTVHDSRDKSFFNNRASHFPHFNFSSVTDPCKLYSGGLPFSSGYESKTEASMSVQLGVSARGVNEYSCGSNKETVEIQPSSSSLGEINLQSGAQPPNGSGGEAWARLLRHPIKSATNSDGDVHSEENFKIPLDIIIDRCILQEILLQYKYISRFTIKLLEEGFYLREHFLALRRYHFMETSDWAHLFVMSLRRQKWSALEPEQEAARIQGLLDLALQRSSCENDPYRERLFISVKTESTCQLAFSNGIYAFDFMVLGYRVDWPISIVVTQDALKIYAGIFSFLIQINLAAASLTDVWHYLKDLIHLWKHDQLKTFREMEGFNVLCRVRQQINHFTSTLQQYVLSHLSDVSWCRFQDSINHVVKDMLDLESAHMLYLADAEHICFLSDDAKEVATIIKNILQCALDFHLCFSGIILTDHLVEVDKSYLHSYISFSQVSTVKATFEKNLKELYILYLNSPKHSEFSLCRFWSHLNYNDYFSRNINIELGYSFL